MFCKTGLIMFAALAIAITITYAKHIEIQRNEAKSFLQSEDLSRQKRLFGGFSDILKTQSGIVSSNKSYGRQRMKKTNM
ncbi:hypothetical protein AC249_AIPGENE12237 [Exaiptasia diaphana]|nr:hypothetical protein AC249_AIPGENE12237 [Exaiptasia diaphana]